MGLFDIFSDQPAKDAAAAQTAGLNAGYNSASGNINSAIGSLNTNYSAALQPYLQNYGNANAGVTQLGNVLGLNGQGGSGQALDFMRNTPGYQFQREQGNNAINAAAAANGTMNSGNQVLALDKYNQGLADSTYSNYVSQLQPFLGASNAATGGIAGVNTGLGNAVAGQQDMLAGLGWNKETGIGNANANADLSRYNASGNFWNMLGGLGGMKTPGGGTLGGNAMSGIGSGLMSLGSSIFSDVNLKEDIEPVGKLNDGQDVYRYRYIGDNVFRIGLMAQDVEKTNPDAVTEIGGFKAVDYGKATRFAADLSRFLEAA